MFSTFTQWVDQLLKAAGHKYIKRIPYASGGKTRYRYIYKLTHMTGGKHVLDPDHMVVGAAFQMETGAGKEVHAHIVSTSGENVTYRLDDGPDKDKVFTVTRAQLAQKLDEKHGARAALRAERDKQSKVVEDLKAGGASTKQVAREQARLDRLEAALPAPAPAPKSEEPKKRAAKPAPRTPTELVTLHEQVYAANGRPEHMSTLSDKDLKEVAAYAKKKAAEFKPMMRAYMKQEAQLEAARRRVDNARTDEAQARAEAELAHLEFSERDEEEAQRYFDGHNEYAGSESFARLELDRRAAERAK